jgi:uncharacterized protein
MKESRTTPQPMQHAVQMQWGVKIPLRDGIHLNATLYLPKNHKGASPAIITLTPYIGQTYHDQGMYFAAHGYPFLTVDVRGRGNSEGGFQPLVNEGRDGFDIVEWLAQQPYCNGKVAMWGGSYAGNNQWSTAKEFPQHLATIVPVAAPYAGVDFPMRNNIVEPYLMKWLTFVSGRTSQGKIFEEDSFWSRQFRQWFESGAPFKDLDTLLGNPSEIFQKLIAHPMQDAYWDSYNPTAEQYSRLTLPILTITGIYDSDQPGALTHYREHLKNTSTVGRTRHYLVIGPWDHAGTRVPKAEFAGLKLGPASLVDLPKLHLEWYAWTMDRADKPAFLKRSVAYYVMSAERWRYADSLEAITARSEFLYLQSTRNPTDIYDSGSLTCEPSAQSEPDIYVYDPHDTTLAELESNVNPEDLTDQRMIHSALGKQLIYHGAPFNEDIEISGFFKFYAWISIDRPDTDFRVSVYEIDLDGRSILLTTDSMRARYRKGLREAKLIGTKEPLRYDFERFNFVSRLIRRGSRLRLIVGPINSIYTQRNHNSGGVVSEETMKDAQPVKVRLFHDRLYPSALYVPVGQAEVPITEFGPR